jgi:hypothetical protein
MLSCVAPHRYAVTKENFMNARLTMAGLGIVLAGTVVSARDMR